MCVRLLVGRTGVELSLVCAMTHHRLDGESALSPFRTSRHRPFAGWPAERLRDQGVAQRASDGLGTRVGLELVHGFLDMRLDGER